MSGSQATPISCTHLSAVMHTSSFPISACSGFTSLLLSSVLHSYENLCFSLDSLVSGSWKSSPGPYLQTRLHLRLSIWVRVFPDAQGASQKRYPQSCSIIICPCGFANDSTLDVTSERRVKVSNELLKVICWFCLLHQHCQYRQKFKLFCSVGVKRNSQKTVCNLPHISS